MTDIFISPSLVNQFVILVALEDTLRNAIDPILLKNYRDEIKNAERLALGFEDFEALWNVTSQNIAGSEEEYAFAFVKKNKQLELAGGTISPIVQFTMRPEEKYSICFTEIALSKSVALSFRSTIFNNALFFKRNSIKKLSLVPFSSVRQQLEFYANQFGESMLSCNITCSSAFAQASVDAETLFYDLAAVDFFYRTSAEKEK